MRKRRTCQARTACRALAFPLFALLVLDTRDSLPLPMLSQRDSQVWWHIELTEPEALAALRTYKAIRRAHPDWYAPIRGTAVMRLDAPPYRQRHDEWTAVFVPWEHMQPTNGQ